MCVKRCIELLLIFSSVGCVSFQDNEYQVAQEFRAHRAWIFARPDRCSANPRSHFSRGWRRGYADVLMGGDGQCPAVPPQCYWSHKYQTNRGDVAVKDWFSGYSYGAAAAIASGCDHYNSVPLADTFRNCKPSCLSSDDSPYPMGKTTLGLRTHHSEPTEELPTPGKSDLKDGETSSPDGKMTPIKFEVPPSPGSSTTRAVPDHHGRSISKKWMTPLFLKSREPNSLLSMFTQDVGSN
jgi:hypothetical protein